MTLLAQKKILITGLISDRSIAYGVAKACFQQGATLAFTYQNDRFKERITDFAREFNSELIFECDVGEDDSVKKLAADLAQSWDGLDGLLHSIAFTPKAGLSGNFVDNVTREVFSVSDDITAYSYVALAREFKQMLINSKGSLVTLTYLGSEKVVPNYNMAGVAKASLEATTRYMAAALGADGVRVNAISAGPIKTLAASGITGFSKILDHVAKNAPLRRNVTALEVGNAAAFLFSNLASAITGEVLYVDAGYNIMASGLDE